jgi:hypothetical protein
MDGKLERKARKFWSWFQEAECELRDLDPNERTIRMLEKHLGDLGVTAWELGPAMAPSARYSLTLSPGGNPDVYRKTRRIIELAPTLEDWELLPAKPRKQWHRKFLWSDEEVPVDASEWRFVVYRYEDGLSTVVLLGDVLAHFRSDEQMRVLMFVLDSELGEASCMELLYDIDIVREPTEQDLQNSIPTAGLFQVVMRKE